MSPLWRTALCGFNLGFYVVSTAAALAWYGGFQCGLGATPGMLLCKLRVAGPGGHGRPPLIAAVARNCPQVVAGFGALSGDDTIDTILAFATLVIYIAIGASISNSPIGQGFHDRLAGGTLVVRRSRVATAGAPRPPGIVQSEPLMQGPMQPTVR